MSKVKFRCNLDHPELLARLRYEAETGNFYWIKVYNGRGLGAIAGTVQQNGYRVISFRKERYLAHRLAWFYVHGKWPAMLIDHIDGDRSNNAIANLREADFSQNAANCVLHKGCWPTEFGTFESKIRVRGRVIYLGAFATEDAARAAYLEAELKYRGEFSPQIGRAA